MKKYAVIGSPIEHSWSPSYFEKKFKQLGLKNYSYDAYRIDNLSSVRGKIGSLNLSGFNVTIPYKQQIIPYLDGISHSAAAINAVNTVHIVQGKWIGYNTDFIGFRQSLEGLLVPQNLRALVFGTGGASLAIKYALNQLGIPYTYVSRSSSKGLSYSAISEELLSKYHLLINTTPIGMYPNSEEELKIPYAGISESHICYDLVYNPEHTKFLESSKDRGATVMNGLQMLKIQADKAWDIWSH